MNLFKSGLFVLASGDSTHFKIECDTLMPEDWRTLAGMIVQRSPPFRSVEGVPRGGINLAIPLGSWATGNPGDPHLVVDDVWTTGGSISKYLRMGDFGWVVFARNPIPEGSEVRALFTLAA